MVTVSNDYRFLFEIRAPIANAMSPMYEDGDQAVISTATQPRTGDHVVASVGQQIVLREYRLRGYVIELAALNDVGATFALEPGRRGQIVGVAIERLHKRRRKH